jgi:small-conductance mechanosensitive channel
LALADIFGVQVPLYTIIEILAITIIAVILERAISRKLIGLAKRIRLEPDAGNNLVLTFRILILIFAVLAISSVGGVQSEWLLSFSAIGGAALGFASQKTVGNFLAGLFLLAAKPFKVGDYVKIGSVEGIVQEITINYAKVLTAANNTISVSNLQILDRDITNYRYQSAKNYNLYCYTFEIGFDHVVSTDRIAEIFDKVFEKHQISLPKKPNCVLTRSAAFERVYTIYLYVEHPEEIFTLRPRIAQDVFQLWDVQREKIKS